MRVKSQGNAGGKLRVERANNTFEILLKHCTECVHDGNRDRAAIIDALCEILQITLIVSKRIGRLQEDAISLFTHTLRHLDALTMFSMWEDDTHRVDGLAVAGRKLVHIVTIPVDHRDVFCSFLTIHHVRCGILRQMIVCASLLVGGILEPANFDDVHTSLLQLLDDSLDGACSKTCLVDICAIAQRAVQQCDFLFHHPASSAKDQNPCLAYCHSP